MKIKDYIDILNFILKQSDSKLTQESTIEFIELLLDVEVTLNHNKLKDFILDVAINSDF